MKKVHEERIPGATKSSGSSKKKRKPNKFTSEMEDMLEINAVHRD